MKLLDQWKVRGPARTIRSELAEWDLVKEQWQPPRRSSLAQLRPDGRVEEQEDHNPNGSISRSRYSYDEAGLLLECASQLNDGPIGKSIFQYDESGRLFRRLSVDGNGVEQECEIYSYDHDRRKTKLEFVPKRENTGVCSTMYGVEGAQQAYVAEGVATITTLYDDHDKPYEAIFHSDSGALIFRVVLTRDDMGRLVREESRCGAQPPFPFAQVLENAPPEERAERKGA